MEGKGLDGIILHALYVCPDEQPEVKVLVGIESQIEELVHGKIASKGIDDGICMMYNELAGVLKMPYNRTVNGEEVYGPFLLLAYDDNGTISSMTDEDMEYFREMFTL